MEYIVIDELFLSDLVTEVKSHLLRGWKLQGGISVARAKYSGGNYDLRYYQAMIKE